VHAVKRQLWYPLGFAQFDLPSGGGRFVVDISETLELKLQAIRAYRTQFPPAKERVFRLVEAQNRLWGYGAGFEAGELFVTSGLPGVTDLLQVTGE
jgi:LmbE family N-acetylglucosaminyl deacetylase